MEDKWVYVLIGAAIIGVPLLLYLFTSGSHKKSVSNIELWEIVKDWRGRTVGVKVHRKVVEG
jgi:predicted acetyltransferase